MNRGNTSVYQYFDKQGGLLYVGVTCRGVRRMDEHAATKAWWPDAAGCTVEHYETRDKALARETYLIATYQPPHNRMCKKKTDVPRVESSWYWKPRLPTCARCNEEKPGRSGICGRCQAETASIKPVDACSQCHNRGHLSRRGMCRSCEGIRGRRKHAEQALQVG